MLVRRGQAEPQLTLPAACKAHDALASPNSVYFVVFVLFLVVSIKSFMTVKAQALFSIIAYLSNKELNRSSLLLC